MSAKIRYLIPEPMDFVSILANRKRPTQRGDVRARWEVEKQREAMLRGYERRRKERAEELQRTEPSIRVKRPRQALTLRTRLAALFRPGEFYAQPDVVRLARGATPPIPVDSVKARLMTMTRDGALYRVENPEYRGETVYRKGTPIHKALRAPPRWLYSLTAVGEALRACALASDRLP